MSDGHDHWAGGKPTHEGAICPHCQIPLLVLWDINCRDPRFPRGRFRRLTRLPLLFCWGCAADLAYRIDSPEKVTIIRGKHQFSGLHYPYKGYPEHFKRQPITLATGWPPRVRKILTRWKQQHEKTTFCIEKLNARDQKMMDTFFGHPVGLFTWCHHQFGGNPSGFIREYLFNRERFHCPQLDCSRSAGGNWTVGPKTGMSLLAVVLNDPWAGLPMIERATTKTKKVWSYTFSVGFHICPECFTIHACSLFW